MTWTAVNIRQPGALLAPARASKATGMWRSLRTSLKPTGFHLWVSRLKLTINAESRLHSSWAGDWTLSSHNFTAPVAVCWCIMRTAQH